LNTVSATKRAVGYLRVSTPGQAGEQHSSLETQESRFKEYCQRQGLLPDSQFVEAVSGRRDDRKEYRRMVEYALTGAAEVIVVQFLDRFGPNPERYCSVTGSYRTRVSRSSPLMKISMKSLSCSSKLASPGLRAAARPRGCAPT